MFNTTFHSFLFCRKGHTCSYLVSYSKNKALPFGIILCFALINGSCCFVVQKLPLLSDFSITSFFAAQPCALAIKSLLDRLFVFCSSTEPNTSLLTDFDLCNITCLRFRCFLVPMRSNVMCLVPYPCAYAPN